MPSQRILEELDLLRKYYPNLEFVEQGLWFRIPDYPLPQEKQWNRITTDVAFQVPAAYPGAPPYGIYVPSGLRCGEVIPDNYQEPAGQQPPFGGQWSMLSWAPDDGQWKPSSILTGTNLLNVVRAFTDRFIQGK
jgi:hypothetical protein